MKVLTILGTRPEIIRLSRIVALLDRLCDHIVVHTGQNYDAELDAIFFEQLRVRQPDHYLGARGSFGQQIAVILAKCEQLIGAERPDRFLVLGDTNSSLAAIIAKRLGVTVYHMEAGNRCYDDRVPEEVNRRIIDHSSDILLPYTERSRANLIREGIPGERIYVTGNPIFEVLQYYDSHITESDILQNMELQPGRYFLVTTHRAENVDVESRLRSIVASLERVQARHCVPVIVSTHPRTRARLGALALNATVDIRFVAPLGFFEFVKLERHARCVISDSGTVQEECAIFGVPNVTIRDTTERPETVECGSNILAGVEPDLVLAAVEAAVNSAGTWSAPREYLVPNVSQAVVKMVLGYDGTRMIRWVNQGVRI